MTRGILIRAENKYMPHNLIAQLCSLMRDYRLPEGTVNMPEEETSAVIGIILYLLEKDPEISRTKLEYEMLLLDNMYLFENAKEYHIIHWEKRMKSGRPCLDEILTFMMDKELIGQKRRQFYVKRHGLVSCGDFSLQLRNWLNAVSSKLSGYSADETRISVKKWIEERTMT